jgi:hypothetical protein
MFSSRFVSFVVALPFRECAARKAALQLHPPVTLSVDATRRNEQDEFGTPACSSVNCTPTEALLTFASFELSSSLSPSDF